MEWINFRHLYSFWMVHRCGGFKAASEEMHVSQSTVSEQVSSLEDYFQKKLFSRNTRSLELTEVGLGLLSYADEIFKKSREINQRIKNEQDLDKSRKRRVGIVGGVSRNLIYRYLSGFVEHGKLTKFDVVNGAFEEHIRLCKKFELDFIISTHPPFGTELVNFNSKIIATSQICLAGTKKAMALLKKKKSSNKTIQLYEFTYPHMSKNYLKRFEKKYDCKFDVTLATDDISLLRFFANSGDGLVVIPEIGIREDIERNLVEAVPLSKSEKINFYAVYYRQALDFDELEHILEK